MPQYSLQDIAAAMGARLEGDGAILISGAAEPADARPDQLALAMNEKYAGGLAKGRARAALLWEGADWQALGLEAALFAHRPRYALAGLSRALDPGPGVAEGVHPSAVIDETARIGPNARIAPYVVIGPGVEIGANAILAPSVTIGPGARIGDDVLLHAGVHVGPRVTIGDRFIAQPGAVIGADGFAFVTPERSSVEQARGSLGAEAVTGQQSWERIHTLGTVEIGDDVEFGANATIDRGTIRATRIGRGTKIDNLVQIGHNVEIGEDCMLCSMVGVSGSVKIGNRVVLAGQVGVNDNIFIGDDVLAGGATKIFTNVPAGRMMLGHPALKMTQQLELYKAIRRLPRLFRDVAALQKAVSKPEQTD